MHFCILTADEVQGRVLEGVARRQGFEATVAPWDAGAVAAVSLHPDAVILDAATLGPEVMHCVGQLHRSLPRSHVFLLVESEPLPQTAADEPPPDATRDVIRDVDLAPTLGVCMIQRKPFHPLQFFRAAVRTIAQEDGGRRLCPVARFTVTEPEPVGAQDDSAEHGESPRY